ncbi:hypothetical protein [Methanoregula sp.]|uniref:hypothetical protein n=1 Tax=Methanoregula sp. TaxID=2052170 RepID=UPI0026292C45|nr:hypothetical protein [Methanoregula sp.]MDD5141923.1 hypothetical protein [Methanoregula sp.]
MSTFPPEYRFLILLALGIIGITAYLRPDTWYPAPALLLLFLGVYTLTRSWPDRGFYIVCSGALLIAGTGAINIWAGLFTAWMTAGTVCSSHGLLREKPDLPYFLGFCGVTFAVALLIEFSNHVLLPLSILTAGCVIVLLVQSVRVYQFKKHYSGGES